MLFEVRSYRAWLLWLICPSLPFWRLLQPWIKLRSTHKISKGADENIIASERRSPLRRMESFETVRRALVSCLSKND